MKIFSPLKGKGSTAAAEEDVAAAEDVSGALDGAKKRLVSSLAKRNLVEHVVPSVIELKRMLEAARSPLLGDLMAATRFLLKDYTTELEEILIADKQLARELKYDLRREEEAAAAADQGVLFAGNKEVVAAARVTTLSAPAVLDRDAGATDDAGRGNVQTLKPFVETPSKLAAAAMPSGDHSEYAGVDAVATPAAAAVLASAAGDSDSRRQKTPFNVSRPTADALCAHENGPLSVPRIRNTPSRTSSLTAAAAAAVSLQNPDELEPELRQWNMNIPEPHTATDEPAEKDAALPRRGRGQKRKA